MDNRARASSLFHMVRNTLVRLYVPSSKIRFILRITTCVTLHLIVLFTDATLFHNTTLIIFELLLHSSTMPSVIGGWLIVHLREYADQTVLSEKGSTASSTTTRGEEDREFTNSVGAG